MVERRAGAELARLTRGQETELPGSAKIRYASAEHDYRPAVAEARKLAGASTRVAQAEIPVMLDPEQAAGIADAWLFETWTARERASFALPPSRLAVEPADVVRLMDAGRSRLLRVTEIGDLGAREIEARGIDPALYALVEGPGRIVRQPPPQASGQPLGYLLDLPLLRGDEPEHSGYFAASQLPWPGPVALLRSPGDAGYTLRALANVPAIMGMTEADLAPGVSGRFDHAGALTVRMFSGELSSVSELQCLAGANTAAVRNADGDWEVIQFRSATLIAPGVYALRTLLRGQAGKEGAMRPGIPLGAPFVLLDAQVARVDLTPDEIGLAAQWRNGPAARDIGHPSYASAEHAFRGIGMRPLSPVHVRVERDASGDLLISWIRRTRKGGETWDVLEVPLSEDVERYEIDILADGAVVRTLQADGPRATYGFSLQLEDFGTSPDEITMRVYQCSAVFGRGSSAEVTLGV